MFFFHFVPFVKSTEIGTYRGGCIICMDYTKYAAESYVRLVRVFEPIAQILTMQLHLLDYMGFDMNNGYLFGFSYGGQLATEAGRRIGVKRLREIDSKSNEIDTKFTYILRSIQSINQSVRCVCFGCVFRVCVCFCDTLIN